MRPDRPPCDAVAVALAAGEPVDPAHLATCAACRARARLVGALGAPPEAPDSVGAGGPTVAGLRAAVRVRTARRGAFVATALVLVALGAFGLRARVPTAAPPVDLLAALDDADRALAPVDPLGEDLLALVDPLSDDLADARPDHPSDPLLDALLGEGSL